MTEKRIVHEIHLQYQINNHVVNGVLHSFMDPKYDNALFLVPGLYGDRCDSRAMYVRLARRLSQAGYNVVRFDYIGGGANLGDYSLNDFKFMTDTLVQFIQQVLCQFHWLKQLGMIGFSEGGKICVRVSGMACVPVSFIGFCNAILVKEELLLPIKRPKLIHNRFVYDSELGTWTSFAIVEEYADWFIDKRELCPDIVYAAVYSDNDLLTASSLEFLQQQGVPVSSIVGGDHLFTSDTSCAEMLDAWESVILDRWPIKISGNEHEFFIRYQYDRMCVKIVTCPQAVKTLVYVHGLGQNKTGPSFLFTNMASELSNMNHIFFDFLGSGDSTGDIADMTMTRYLDQLSFMVDYTQRLFPATEVILVGSGAGNAYLVLCKKVSSYKKVFIHPEDIYIWDLISDEEKALAVIDTYTLFRKYDWAAKEFLKLGNVFNRSSGFLVDTGYLQAITHVQTLKHTALADDNAVCVTNEELIGNRICVCDDSYLLMSAKLRSKVLQELKKRL